jgi:hypothetical protein
MSDLFENGNRRDFLRKTAYVVPAIMSVNVALASARAGSLDPIQQRAKGASTNRGSRDGERVERRSDREK